MLNQKMPTHHQSKGTPGPEHYSYYSAAPTALKKRIPRRLLIVITVITSIVTLLYFPPHTVLYTWTTKTTQSAPDSPFVYTSLTVNVKDGSRDWNRDSLSRNGLFASPSYNSYHRPQSSPQFDNVPDEAKRLSNPSSRVDQSIKLVDTEPRESYSHEEKEAVPIFDRLVVKEAPKKPYKPLPRLRARPDVQYENVRPSVHYLTRELESTKFLTFLPHSGFHNQRIEIQNAFKLAKLLNRTLILPPFRLGSPLSWDNSTLLSQALERDEKKYERSEDCLKLLSESNLPLSAHSSISLEECKYDSSWTAVQVDYMLDLKDLYDDVPVIDRTDLREEWLWNTLNLYPGEWLEVQDSSRYSYQIYESSTASSVTGSKYEWRLNIDDLADYSHTRLLSFGSLFGSGRVILDSPEMKKFVQKIVANQMPNLPLLERISDRMADRMGGRGSYVGIHLRVANAFFVTQAPRVIREIFNQLCKEILKIDQKTIENLIAQSELAAIAKSGNKYKPSLRILHNHDQPNSRSELSTFEVSKYRDMDPKYEPKMIADQISERVKRSRLNPTRMGGRSSSEATLSLQRTQRLKCKGKLYEKKGLLNLNVPIYISTDLRSTESFENAQELAIFYANLPCVFSSNDLQTSIKPNTRRRARGRPNQPDQPLDRGGSTAESSEHASSPYVLQTDTSDYLEEDTSHEDTDDPMREDGDLLDAFHRLKSNLDGTDLDSFLFPVLEAMIVSKGSHFIGTPKSTFSNYVANVLHPGYQRSGSTFSS